MGILHNYNLSISDNCQKQLFGDCSFAVLLKTHLLSTLFTNTRLLRPQKQNSFIADNGTGKGHWILQKETLISNKSLCFCFTHEAKSWPVAKLQLVVITTTMKVVCMCYLISKILCTKKKKTGPTPVRH